jgi:NaMN:DMB phosphoribosyltransferase
VIFHIDVSTVGTHRARIKEKMHLRDAKELLQAAIRWNVAKSDCGPLVSGEADLRKPLAGR